MNEPHTADDLHGVSVDDSEQAPNSLTATCRRDGWTPFARRLFLEVLAETGRVTTACEYAQLTKQSAYALRARDRVFAASWDAACELARAPLADALYERALDGVTETISKDGEVVATRHRFDSRLSVAVLHRLDKRCDRALEAGAHHLALVRRWDEWIELVGKGEEQAALALLESASHGQFGQLPESGNPTQAAAENEGIDLSDRCWLNADCDGRVWMTDFPPPPGYSAYQSCDWGDPGTSYQRECTPEEVAILEADAGAARAAARGEEEALRDSWFELLKSELPSASHVSAEQSELASRDSELRTAVDSDLSSAGQDAPGAPAKKPKKPKKPKRKRPRPSAGRAASEAGRAAADCGASASPA